MLRKTIVMEVLAQNKLWNSRCEEVLKVCVPKKETGKTEGSS